MNTLIRYANPAVTLSNLFDELINDSFFSCTDRDVSLTTWPRVDIVEEEKAYKLHADLPGLDKKDINITLENGVLTIKGEKKEEKRESKTDRYYHYERRYGAFQRSFSLPDHVDNKHVDANYKNGVLEITLKKSEKAQPKAIEVNVE